MLPLPISDAPRTLRVVPLPALRASPAPASPAVSIWWLRGHDVRLHDQPALAAAGSAGSVQAAYTWSEGDSSWLGRAQRVFVHHALCSLDGELRQRFGSRLLCGSSIAVLASQLGARTVHSLRRYEPEQAAADAATASELEALGVSLSLHAGYLLHEPTAVKLDLGTFVGHYGTLSPFLRACQRLPAPGPQAQVPPAASFRAASAPAPPCSLPLEAVGLLPGPPRSGPDWRAGLLAAWGGAEEVSEAAALRRCDAFCVTQMRDYEAAKARADGSGVSRLSYFLRAGLLSPRRLAVAAAAAGGAAASRTFAHRLHWRDLAYWQLHLYPHLPRTALRPSLASLPWAPEPLASTRLRAWQRGCTGFPLVDAGMRELRATGWMQQSVRMVVASFLVRVLHVSWTHGLAWFADNLIDADAAINAMMWSNCAGAAIDPWGFALSPISRHQDPSGAYIRRWLPELTRLPPKYTHAPWTASAEALQAAGVELGVSYPHRLLEDTAAADAAYDAACVACRLAAAPEWRDGGGYDLIDVPSGAVAAPHPLAKGGRVRVYTLEPHRVPGAGSATAAPPASRPSKVAPRPRPAERKPRAKRVSLADAPVVGAGVARRDRPVATLRKYAHADAVAVADAEAELELRAQRRAKR